eukprot:tig00020563_g11242.t1
MLLVDIPGGDEAEPRDEEMMSENDGPESSTIKPGVGPAANMRAKLLRLQDDVLDYQEKVVEERVRNEMLDKQMKELRSAIENQIIDMGGEMQPSRTRGLCARLIENQETKLLKLSNDVSSTVEENRRLKELVSNMRLDRSQFQDHCARRERDIRDRTKRIMDMLKHNSKLYEERNHLKEQTSKLQAAWQEEAMRLNQERDMLDQEIAKLSTDEDLALDRRISSLAVTVKEKFTGKHKEAKEADAAAQALRRLQLMEEGLQRILTATSCESADELVKRFQERDHDIFSMFRHLDLQSQEIQGLEDAIAELRGELEALEGPAGAQGDEEGRPRLSETSGARTAQSREVARLEALAESYEKRFQSGISVLDGVKAVVERLIVTLDIKESETLSEWEEPLPIGGVLEGNVHQWLGLIEAKASQRLVATGHLRPRPAVPARELQIPESMFRPTSLADLDKKMSVEDAIRHDALLRMPPRTARTGGGTTRRRGQKALFESSSTGLLSARGPGPQSPTAAQQAAAEAAAAAARGLGFKIAPPNIEGDGDTLKAFAEAQDAARASEPGAKGKAEAEAELKEAIELKALEARERYLASLDGPRSKRVAAARRAAAAGLSASITAASTPSQSLRARAAANALAAAGVADPRASTEAGGSVRSSRGSQREGRTPGTGDSAAQPALVLGVQNSPVSAAKSPPLLQFGQEFFDTGVRMLSGAAGGSDDEEGRGGSPPKGATKGLSGLASLKGAGGGAKSTRGKRKEGGEHISRANSEGSALAPTRSGPPPKDQHQQPQQQQQQHQQRPAAPAEDADPAAAAAAAAAEEAMRGVARSLAEEAGEPVPPQEDEPLLLAPSSSEPAEDAGPPASSAAWAYPSAEDAEVARVLEEVGLDLGGPSGAAGDEGRAEGAAPARAASEEPRGGASPPPKPGKKRGAKGAKPAAGSGRVAAQRVHEARAEGGGGAGPLQDALDGGGGGGAFDGVILPETRFLWDMLVSTHPRTRKVAEKISDRAMYPAGLRDAVQLQHMRRSASERGVEQQQPPARASGLGHSASASAVGYGAQYQQQQMYAQGYYQQQQQPQQPMYGAWQQQQQQQQQRRPGPMEEGGYMEALDYAAVAEGLEAIGQQQWALAQQQQALLAQLPPGMMYPGYGGVDAYPAPAPAAGGPGGPRKMRSPYVATMDMGEGPIAPSPQARALAAKRRGGKPRRAAPGHASAPNLMQPLDAGAYAPAGGFPPPQYQPAYSPPPAYGYSPQPAYGYEAQQLAPAMYVQGPAYPGGGGFLPQIPVGGSYSR